MPASIPGHTSSAAPSARPIQAILHEIWASPLRAREAAMERVCSRGAVGWRGAAAPGKLPPRAQSQAGTGLCRGGPGKPPLPRAAVLRQPEPPKRRTELRQFARKRARGCSAQVQSSAKMLNYSSAGALSPSARCADGSLIISSIQRRRPKTQPKTGGGTAGAPRPAPRFAARL